MFDLMNEISELVYVADIDTYELLFMNTAGKKMFHISEMTGETCYKLLHGHDKPCEFCTNSLLTIDDFHIWEYTNKLVNRHYLLKDKLVNYQGKIARLEIALDITEQEMQKIVLQNALDCDVAILDSLKILYTEENTSAALDKILNIVGTALQAERTYIFDISENHLQTSNEWHSPAAADLEGVSKWTDAIVIEHWNDIFSQHEPIVIDDVEQLRDEPFGEYALLKARGIKRFVLVPLELDKQITGFIGVTNPPPEKLANISLIVSTLGYFITSYIQRHQDQQRLEKLSYYDTLTGIFNRNAFVRDSHTVLRCPHESLGVVQVDVNGMKALNEAMGHTYGDEVLLKTAQIIQKAFPKALAYRLGGDEFSLFIYGSSQVQFEKDVHAMTMQFSQNEEFHVSVGFDWSEQCEDVKQMIVQADDMMSANKKSFYHTQAIPKRYRHENDDVLHLTKPGNLQNMLAEHCFPIYLQPKVAVDDRSLIGAEALIRLHSPAGMLIMPDEFIPLMEESRLISMIDFFVFESVCAKIKEWIADGKKVVPISVNFSRYSLTERHFAQTLKTIWQKYQIPQNLVEIEITESMNADDTNLFLEVVEQIKRLGFIISIDDFGVKHANLSLFTQIQFDVLKIDKGLIMDLQQNKISQIVLSSLSDICRQMGIHLVAEGVETEEQLATLKKLGCEWAQGYLFDRPIPLKSFEEKYILC